MQDETRRFWKSARGPAWFQAWGEMRRRDGAPVYIESPEARAHHEVITLAGARTYFVTEDMLALARHATETMPDEALLESDLPAPNGFLVFERGVVFPDVRGSQVVLTAFAWRRGVSDGRPYLFWTYYSDVEDDRDDYRRAHGPTTRDYVFPVTCALLAEDLEVFGEPAATAEDIVGHYVHAAGVESVKRTLVVMHDLPRALFSLLNSSITEAASERASRPVRRRLEKAKSPVTGDVVVIRLRRAHHEADAPATGSVEWSHRWIVSGHWRNAWRPSVGAHRRVWIAPFVKGPEDRPLVVTRKVHVLER